MIWLEIRDEIVVGRDEFDAKQQTQGPLGASYKGVVEHPSKEIVMSNSVIVRAAAPRFKVALAVLTGSLGMALAAGAAAVTVDNDVPSLVVRYDSQALATDSGVQHLYRRILFAATQVCPEVSIKDLGANARAQACRAQAVAHAVQHIGNARLASLYATSSKSG